MMNLKQILKRIELQRESYKRSSYDLPYDEFLERNASAAKLLEFVFENTRNRKIRLEAKKYFIIACVSAMEIYFREMARILIDSELIFNKFRKILRNYKFTLEDLTEIMDKEISIGEIISVSHSFQNLDEINKLYSDMLGVNFVNEVKRVKVEPDAGEPYTLEDKYSNFWKKIEELIKLRHTIIHYGNLKLPRINSLIQLWENLLAFVTAADFYLLGKILDRLEKK